jgi:hypothetical protein
VKSRRKTPESSTTAAAAAAEDDTLTLRLTTGDDTTRKKTRVRAAARVPRSHARSNRPNPPHCVANLRHPGRPSHQLLLHQHTNHRRSSTSRSSIWICQPSLMATEERRRTAAAAADERDHLRVRPRNRVIVVLAQSHPRPRSPAPRHHLHAVGRNTTTSEDTSLRIVHVTSRKSEARAVAVVVATTRRKTSDTVAAVEVTESLTRSPRRSSSNSRAMRLRNPSEHHRQ